VFAELFIYLPRTTLPPRVCSRHEDADAGQRW